MSTTNPTSGLGVALGSLCDRPVTIPQGHCSPPYWQKLLEHEDSHTCNRLHTFLTYSHHSALFQSSAHCACWTWQSASSITTVMETSVSCSKHHTIFFYYTLWTSVIKLGLLSAQCTFWTYFVESFIRARATLFSSTKAKGKIPIRSPSLPSAQFSSTRRITVITSPCQHWYEQTHHYISISSWILKSSVERGIFNIYIHKHLLFHVHPY